MSGFLLDTNVPSEVIRVRPDSRVLSWVLGQDDVALDLSAVTVGELRKGLTLLPAGKRRFHLEAWLDNDLLPLFAGRVWPVTQVIAEHGGGVASASLSDAR